jgi:hypothetical protein
MRSTDGCWGMSKPNPIGSRLKSDVAAHGERRNFVVTRILGGLRDIRRDRLASALREWSGLSKGQRSTTCVARATTTDEDGASAL